MSTNLEIIGRINFTTVQKYLLTRSWEKTATKNEYIAVFRTLLNERAEIILPLSREFKDYNEALYRALKVISVIKNRSVNQIINDLLLPPSDVIRFRVKNKRTEGGNIPFSEGFKLLENAKKTLFTSACDLIQPEKFHKRLSFKSAQQLIDSCMLGQTERGSFIASVVCPFINESEDDKPNQLSLFNSTEELQSSFTRRVTSNIMTSIDIVKNAIETANEDQLIEPKENKIISANFLESVVELGEYGEKDEIQLFTSWAATAPAPSEIPNSIILTKDYIPPIEKLIERLKPIDEGEEGVFVGKVSKAEAHPDPLKRSRGDIIFNFLSDDDKVIKAKVSLSTEDFSKALSALDEGKNVKIGGVLKTSGRTKLIESPSFEIID